MKKLIIACIGGMLLGSCLSTNISKKEKETIAISMDLNRVVDDKVEVVVDPHKLKTTSTTYQIPAIVPGTYAMSNYGKFVSNFKAFDYKGNELEAKQLDSNSWEISNAEQLDKISYWVDDTFDSEQEHGIYVMAGTNIEEGKNFFLNLPGFIGYFKDLKEVPYQIAISHPADLYETSSLINKNTTKEDNSKDIFVAARYDEISDNPIMYAPLNTASFTVDGINVNFAVYSPNNIHKAADMEADLKKMMQAQSNFLEGFTTTSEYNILLYLFDDKVYKWSSFGALEHLSSTTVVYPESFSKEQLAEGMINGTISHEFFHIVTPLSVHSEHIHSFDFNTPSMSKHLWMYEGITEYFANLFQVQQGLISEQDFINAMQGKISSSMRYNDSMSFTKMSKHILEKKYARNYGNVYQKGALIGMCLDLILREESNGTYGVRNLMKDLATKYGARKAFNDDGIIQEITQMTYPSVGAFFKNHVEGNTPIDYGYFFKKAGIAQKMQTVDSRYFVDAANSPFISVNEKREIYFTKRSNTGLEALGVQENDVLKTVNGEPLTLQNANNILIKTFAWKVGDSIRLEVTRDGKTVLLEGVAIAPMVTQKGFGISDTASSEASALRKAWLKG